MSTLSTWRVDHPATYPPYERFGLASAALAALRQDYLGLSWHTGSGHGLAPGFWRKVGSDVQGGYTSRADCKHGWEAKLHRRLSRRVSA